MTPSRTGICALAALVAGTAAAGVLQAWEIRQVLRSDEGMLDVDSFGFFGRFSLADQYVVISDTGVVAIRYTDGAVGGDGVITVCDDCPAGIFAVHIYNPYWMSEQGIAFLPEIAIRGDIVAASVPSADPLGGPDPEERVVLADARTGDVVYERPNAHPIYPIDGLALTEDGSIAHHVRIGLAGFGLVFLNESSPWAEYLTSTNGEISLDDYIASSFNGAKHALTVETPYSDFPPTPPRDLALYVPSDALYGNDRKLLRSAVGEIGRFAHHTAISDSGRMLYVAKGASDGRYSVTRIDGPGAPDVHIADLGPISDAQADGSDLRPALNDAGLVAYRTPDGPQSAVFIADGDTSAQISGPGALVDTDLGPLALGFAGQVVNGRVSINTHDVVAFSAWLENGTVGVFTATPVSPGCNDADLAVPLGVLDLADIQSFIKAFVRRSALVDTAPPQGVWDLADLAMFVQAFATGCP